MRDKLAVLALPALLQTWQPAGFAAAQADFEAKLVALEATYKPPGVSTADYEANYYQATFSWTHDTNKAVVLNKDKIRNPMQEGGACDPATTLVASQDGIPYWMPRFYPKPVPADVTEVTGIRFASVDWQPCGHKDIVICHGESHYDFHLYYVTETQLEDMGCSVEGEHQLICREDNVVSDQEKFEQNHKFFELMEGNIPETFVDASGNEHAANYCVDPTSAVPKSGIHYGDRSETLKEWKSPVTIIGSHDCQLKFFEPMLSWRWMGDLVYGSQGWPRWDSKWIEYNNKTVKSLPVRWAVDVTTSCKDVARKELGYSTDNENPDPCQVKVTVVGERCPAGSDGCKAMIEERRCGRRESCLKSSGLPDGGSLYQSPTTNFKVVKATPAPTAAPTAAPGSGATAAKNSSSGDEAAENSSAWKYGADTHYFCNGHTIVYGVNDHQHDELCENNTKNSSDTSPAAEGTTKASTTATTTTTASTSSSSVAALAFKAEMKPAAFDEGAFVAAVAKASGVAASAVVVKSVVFDITVGYKFSVQVTEQQAAAAVASANNVSAADVTILSIAAGSGSSASGSARRLSSETAVDATVRVKDKARAAQVQAGNEGDVATTALAGKLQALLGVQVDVTKTKAPKAVVIVETAVTTASGQAAGSLSAKKEQLGSDLAGELGVTVEATAGTQQAPQDGGGNNTATPSGGGGGVTSSGSASTETSVSSTSARITISAFLMLATGQALL
eukprot:TRINITY_DN21170_c0_g1_i1.p1 TRINITY_DN21170_c0_g1~~TRINITY_DN21170_c0_g1_i1.p1  ORF type:complete len:750 (+),score=206.25 TRINITY_DN21170_c0_g1_i1:54-2252(+)